MALERQHRPLAAELTDAFQRTLASSAFILGREAEAFEQEFAGYCGTAHAVGVNSGTAALSIMFRAAGIGAGDEVIVPAHTFIASALAIVDAGATPVCVDVLSDSGLIDPDAAAAAVGPRTAAILAVHLYGQVCDMDGLSKLAARQGLALFEDAAQSHGAMYAGRRAGSLGRAAAFSFYPSKNLGALGDAGAICTNDEDLAQAARRIRDLGRAGAEHHFEFGLNERLDGIQAACMRIKLPHLDGWNEARRGVAAIYRERLEGLVELLPDTDPERCVYHLFPIRVAERDDVAQELRRRGVATKVHYPHALPQQPALPMLHGASAPNARDWAQRELSLPIFPEITSGELDLVTSSLDSILSGESRPQG